MYLNGIINNKTIKCKNIKLAIDFDIKTRLLPVLSESPTTSKTQYEMLPKNTAFFKKPETIDSVTPRKNNPVQVNYKLVQVYKKKAKRSPRIKSQRTLPIY